MDSDLAQGGQSASEMMFSRARVLAVKNRKALSGMLTGQGGQVSLEREAGLFRKRFHLGSLRAESRAGRTS